MFYINKDRKFKPIPPSQIHTVLLIPPIERQVKDHQLVYRYFANHSYLDQIERSKSVNARMKCVASIQLVLKNQFKEQKHVYLSQIQEEIAVLSLKKVKQFLSFDQRPIRQKMQRLSSFKLLSFMKYNELLFLAQMYSQHQFKYAEFLFKQNDKIQNFYLVEIGQFHYVKFYEQDETSTQKYKIDLKKSLKKNKKTSKTSFPFFNQQTVNKVRSKSKKYKQYRVGFVEGQAGQSIGQEQIILQKSRRQYGAKCFSTSNRVLVFDKSVLQIILSQNDSMHQKLRIQTMQRWRMKRQLIDNIKETKGNIHSVIKLIQIEKEKEKKRQVNLLLFQNQLNNFKLPVIRHKQNASELPDIGRKFSSMSKVKEKSIFMTQDLNQNKYASRQSNQSFKTEGPDEQSETFALTEFKKTKPKQKKSEDVSIQRQMLIEDASFDDSIKMKPSKSWNVNLANHQIKNKISFKQKYVGMIDSSTLVKEKEYIVSIKKDKQVNDTGKQFQIKQRALWRLMQKEKQKAKVKSPAHSKHFMQKMLLSALRKAGYNQASPMIQTEASGGITERQLSQQLQRQIQIKQQLKKVSKKLKNTKKMQANSQVLQTNAFDECYFGKLD